MNMIMNILSATPNGSQVAIAIALLICYAVYCAVYVVQLFHPIATVHLYELKGENSKPFLQQEIKEPKLEEDEEVLDESEATKPKDVEETSFAHWTLKSFHQNILFFTVACLLSMMATKNVIIVLLAYIGLICKIGQAVGLLLSKEIICKIMHGCTVGVNIIMMLFSIINYE